jgi:hypothetical protein
MPTFPLTAGMTEMLTTPVTKALTLNPTAIVLTDWRPRIVTPCVGFIHTGTPETETDACVVTATISRRLTVPDITVVPAPAVTVPVTTTGKAVVDCPPTIHMI